MEVGEEVDYIPNDSCIKMDSDGSHFNVINCEGQKSQDCVHTHTQQQKIKRKENRSGIEPRPFCLPAYNALPLGQTGSQALCVCTNLMMLRVMTTTLSTRHFHSHSHTFP